MSKTPYPKQLTLSNFLGTFGNVYELSPWVAEEVYSLLKPGIETRVMASLMESVVNDSPDQDKLKLLRLHPDLASRLGVVDLTESSQLEQAGAGLDQCTSRELQEFQELNANYIDKFGFPFIFAVKGFQRTDILEAFRARIKHDCPTEFKTAIAQVHRIARLRLETIANEI